MKQTIKKTSNATDVTQTAQTANATDEPAQTANATDETQTAQTTDERVAFLEKALKWNAVTDYEYTFFKSMPVPMFENGYRKMISDKMTAIHETRVGAGYAAINTLIHELQLGQSFGDIMDEYELTQIVLRKDAEGNLIAVKSMSNSTPSNTAANGGRAQKSGKWEFTNGVLTFPSLRSMMLHYDETKDGIGGKPICQALRKHIKFTEWTVRNVDTNETEKFDVWAVAQYDVKQP